MVYWWLDYVVGGVLVVDDVVEVCLLEGVYLFFVGYCVIFEVVLGNLVEVGFFGVDGI